MKNFLVLVAIMLGGLIVTAILDDAISSQQADPEIIIVQNEYQGHSYPEVAEMLSSDSIMDIHRFWGVCPPEDVDWEETAFSLGVNISELTIDMYMDHLQHGAESKYIRNRAVK